ncbi:MAG TPA: hypothetical protein PLC61_09765 [Chitinophagales bacterium]|nr:hypothetical protein [Chitinophagales bacterium]
MARALVNKSVEEELYEPELFLEFECDRYGDMYVKRKFNAAWTPELAQDLEAYHSIDAEAELEALLAEGRRREIDREIINELFKIKGIQENGRTK